MRERLWLPPPQDFEPTVFYRTMTKLEYTTSKQDFLVPARPEFSTTSLHFDRLASFMPACQPKQALPHALGNHFPKGQVAAPPRGRCSATPSS